VGVDAASFKSLITEQWSRLYNYSLRMCLDPERADEVVEEVFLRAYVGSDKLPEGDDTLLWLLKIAQHVLDNKLGRTPEVSFDVLDDTLRSEATRTDVVRSLTEPRRDFLLWELKQGCMTSVVNCLSPGERAAFVLSTILKLGDDAAAKTLGVTKSAYKVRLSRAKKKITDYLAPRCEHVDPMNPCRCPARVGVALSKGFIKSGGEVSLRNPQPAFGRYGSGPSQEDMPLRDVEAIYGNLPEPEGPTALLERLMDAVDSGRWEQVRAEKASQE
jgi:RNA polymerase sigma-70 factor (ECF subfamily)